MLKRLRKNTKVIIWIVVISFAIGGGFVVGTSLDKKGRVAGRIFDRDVSFREFQNFLQGAALTGKRIADPELMRQKTWANLIYSEEAKRRGIKVSDDEVRNELRALLKGANMENIRPQAYEAWLKKTFNQTPKEFESQLRELMRIRKLIASVATVAVEPASQKEVEEKFTLDHTLLKAEALILPTKEAAESLRNQAQKDAAAWTTRLADTDSKIDADQEISLMDLAMRYRLSVPAALQLAEVPLNEISTPSAVGTDGRFALFRILERKNADLSQLDEETTQQYMEKLKEMERQVRFHLWNQDLFQRANLQDFIKGSASETS